MLPDYNGLWKNDNVVTLTSRFSELDLTKSRNTGGINVMRCTLLVRASAFAIFAAGMSATVQAQTTPADPAATIAPDTDNPTQPNSTLNADGTDRGADQAEEITVTGSRIRLPNITSLQPTATVSRRYLEERGFTNAADALNELPGIRGSVSPNGAQGSFGQGVNFVNGFGLGSNRTLTLVNGRRFVSSNVPTLFGQGSAGTQVDINNIPTALIESIDNVSIGGAPIYGSDAIAGTINFKLRTDFTGLQVSGVSSVTEQGDAYRYNFSAVGGFNFAGGRGNVTASYTRDHQDGVLYNARGFLRENIGGANNPTTAQSTTLGRPAGTSFANDGRLNPNIGYNDSTTDGFPGSVLVRNRTIPLLNGGGVITSAFNAANASVPGAVQNFQFNRSGNLVAFNRGIRFVTTQEASGGDGFRFNDYSQITSDVGRDIGTIFANYEVSPAVKLFAEGWYSHSRGDELVQQPTFNSNLFGGAAGALTFNVNTPFLTDEARAQLQALGVNRFSVSRASADLSDPTGFSTNDVYRLVYGVRGDVKLGSRNFNYEISANYGRADILDSGQDLNQQRFVNAVNVTRNASGQIVCNTAVTAATNAAPGGLLPVADAACVPLNLLGEGLSDPAARAYVIQNVVTRSRLQQAVLNANFGGSPFDLFGNPVGFNIGYEHRQEEGSFTPSAFQQAGLGRSVAIAPVSGRYNVDEAFGEVIVPLVTPNNGLRFLNRLELNASGRYVDNTVNGGFFAWSAGGIISPIRDISFRGNYTKSFRAPAITELFLPTSNAFSTVTDYCNAANINAGPAPANRARNCAAFIATFPNATPLDASFSTVPSRSGGNPTLDNEVARSFTYGVILEPRFIPGLTISVDYTSIKISKPIASLTIAQIGSACFDNDSFDASDPANGNAFCSLLRRYPAGSPGMAANGGPIAGQIISDPANPGINFAYTNGNKYTFNGIQSELDYFRPLSGLGLAGSAGIQGRLQYVHRRINDVTGIAPTRIDGTYGDPTFQGQLTLRYVGEQFGISSSFQYTGEQLASRVSRGADIREIDEVDDYVLVNPSMYFDVEKKFRLTFSVSNLFNRHGQKYYGAYIPNSYLNFDTTSLLLGRRFTVAARATF